MKKLKICGGILCMLVYGVWIGFVCFSALKLHNKQIFAVRLKENSQIVPVSFKRLSFCSLETFPGITKSGLISAEGHVAVSRDLEEYFGYYLYLSGEMYLVTDFMNRRYKKSVDIYVDLNHREAMALGVRRNAVGYFILLPYQIGRIK